MYQTVLLILASSDVNCLAILAKALIFLSFCLPASRRQQAHMYSTCFSTKMLLAKLAQKSNSCLTKSDAMWSMAQMTTGSASLDNDGDGSVSGTTFHTYTACTQCLWWEKHLSPSHGSYCGS